MVSWTPNPPFGLSDLEENAADRYSLRATEPLLRADQVRCCIQGCKNWLARRRRTGNREDAYCPTHGISVSTSPTYVYQIRARNFIVGQELLAVIHKVERWRLGNECSEDALTWNVFLGLSRLGALSSLFKTLTGVAASTTPELYLWGNRVDVAPPCF